MKKHINGNQSLFIITMSVTYMTGCVGSSIRSTSLPGISWKHFSQYVYLSERRAFDLYTSSSSSSSSSNDEDTSTRWVMMMVMIARWEKEKVQKQSISVESRQKYKQYITMKTYTCMMNNIGFNSS